MRWSYAPDSMLRVPTSDARPQVARAFWRGVADMAPILLGVVPFGLVAGVAAVDAGIGVVGAVAFSVVVFAGASQIAAITLLGAGAPATVAVFTGIVINLRMVMYSASIAQQFTQVSLPRRLVGAYLLTDQAYAVSVADHHRHPERSIRERIAVYLGAALALWLTWQVSTVVGAVGGGLVPADVPLEFAIPLAFLSLLVPAMTDRPAVLAAVVGGVVATLGVGLPHNLGMPLGAVTGVVSGWLAARRDGFGNGTDQSGEVAA